MAWFASVTDEKKGVRPAASFSLQILSSLIYTIPISLFAPVGSRLKARTELALWEGAPATALVRTLLYKSFLFAARLILIFLRDLLATVSAVPTLSALTPPPLRTTPTFVGFTAAIRLYPAMAIDSY